MTTAITNAECSLYVHIPFCVQKCDYCAFYSTALGTNGADILNRYIDVLIFDVQEQLQQHAVCHVPTVYIGGGTPSILPPRVLERLLAALCTILPNMPSEWTIEINPEYVNDDFLRVCKEYGITRISAGVQTFYQMSRDAVGRAGDCARMHKNLAHIARLFEGGFSADLICALPYSNTDVLKNDIQTLLDYAPAHVSLYDLTLEEDTPLCRRLSAGGAALAAAKLPTEEEAATLWLLGRTLLEENGYRQYEVSNFARPGGQCAHNLRYWQMQSWLGAGPSASGTVIHGAAGVRATCPPDVARYLRSAPPAAYQHEELSRAVLMEESMLMGFRTRAGLDEALFERRFGRPPASLIPCTIERWRRRGLFCTDTCALTADGLAVLNRFLREALTEFCPDQ